MLLANIGKTDSIDIILANGNSLEYLKSEIDTLNTTDFGEKYYYIIPESISSKEDVLRSLDLKLQNYLKSDELEKKEVIYYRESARLINIDELLPLYSKISENPIIVLDNTPVTFNEDEIEGNPFRNVYDTCIMYKMNEPSFEEFIIEYDLNSEVHGKSNVYDVYRHNRIMMQRVLRMSLVISAILVLLELTVLTTLIKLEFRLNAYSISLKKILGYTLWERYSKLTALSAVGSIIAAAAFISFDLYYKSVPIAYGSAVILSIYILEQILVSAEIKRMECHNIHIVLKGEFR